MKAMLPLLRCARQEVLLSLLSRLLAAVFGGYLLTAITANLLSGLLPFNYQLSALCTTAAAFTVYILAILRAFTAPRSFDIWCDIGLVLLLQGVVLLLQQ